MLRNVINNLNLPSEIIYMIISYVPHPLTIIIKPISKEYEQYTYNSDNIISFNEYLKYDPNYLFDEYNIKLHKKDNDGRLRCFNCGYYFKKHDIYYKCYTLSKNENCINCNKCFVN